MNNEETREREFATPFRAWLISKFGTYKQAADHLDVSAPYLSQIIKRKNPPAKFRANCIDYGFESKYFTALDSIGKVKLDTLTFEEIKFLYLECKFMLTQKNDVIRILEDQIKRLNRNG